MPMLQVFRCPICKTESEPTNVQPAGWVLINMVGGGEVFDKWECVEKFATQQQQVLAE